MEINKKIENNRGKGDNKKPKYVPKVEVVLKPKLTDHGDSNKTTDCKKLELTTITANRRTDSKITCDQKPVNKLLEERKRLRDKYTFKLTDNTTAIAQDATKTTDQTKTNETELGNDVLQNTVRQGKDTDSVITKSTDSNKTNRRPVVRTISMKNAKTFKTVSFTHQKQVQLTPLKIKIPLQSKRNEISIQANNQNDNTEKEKPVKKISNNDNENEKVKPVKKTRKRWLNKRIHSPDVSMVKHGSPPTEVAKWAPNTINQHTKPYYEAWVNTKLAAITKKITLDHKLLESIEKSFNDRCYSPELIYEDFKDERYTGKIIIRHKIK